jgi:glycosyltransferase involved in cell wall biosynthesis
VPYPDIGAFAEAVAGLLEDEPERRRRGEVARERVSRDHAVEVAGRQLVADLWEVLERVA